MEEGRAGGLANDAEQDLEDFVDLWKGEENWFERAVAVLEERHSPSRRAAGRRKAPPGRAPPKPQEVENYKGPTQVREEGAKVLAPTALHSREKLEEEKLQLVLDKLAESTRKSYSLGWRWWSLFCRARGASPLRHVTPDSLPHEESLFLDFAIHVALHGGKAAGTLQQYLSAVRSQHLVLGFPDPTRPMLRLWMAMDGLRKRQGGPKRKRPATPEMLRWLHGKLDIQKRRDDAMLWCAIALAYFFLLRASEYVAPDQSGADNGKGVRAIDLVARREGTQVKSFREADEVALCIRGSKTDQLNRWGVAKPLPDARRGALCGCSPGGV